MSLTLATQKRARTTLRAAITRFATDADAITPATSTLDLEVLFKRITDSYDALQLRDEAIHGALDDAEYDADVPTCELYHASAARTLTTIRLEQTRRNQPQRNTGLAPPHSASAFKPRLPTLQLDAFDGRLDTWRCFWEQFTSSIDANTSLSDVDKHVFLRSYLTGEPKTLVEGISVTAATYASTKVIFEKRYGRTGQIIQVHLDRLATLRPAASSDAEDLNNTYLEVNRHISALEALGENVAAYGRMVSPMILRAFPPEICHRWIVYSRREGISDGDVPRLLTFLDEEVDGARATSTIRGDSVPQASPDYLSTAATLQVNTQAPPKGAGRTKRDPFCVLCDTKGHWPQKCTTVTDVAARKKKIRTDGRCFLCLAKGHDVATCPRRSRMACSACKQAHHTSLCAPHITDVGKVAVSIPTHTHLQTARLWIKGPSGIGTLARCVLDGGSQSSFISQRLVNSLQLKLVSKQELCVRGFETTSTASVVRRQVQFCVASHWNSGSTTITALESDNAYSHHPPVPPDIEDLARAMKFRLADPMDDKDLPIEILIGGDCYWRFGKTDAVHRISPSLTLIPSTLGWILSGARTGTTVGLVSSDRPITVNHVSFTCDAVPDDICVQNLWDIDTLGICERATSKFTDRETEILTAFRESRSTDTDGRCVVSLPRKTDCLITSVTSPTHDGA